MKIVTRIATKEDAATIALLGRVTFSDTFGDLFRDRSDLLEYFKKTFTVEKIESSILKSSNIFWLALADGLPVGYAKLKLDSLSSFLPTQRVCQLQKIYVLNDFLSLKIGQKLQQQVIQKSMALAFQSIWLSVLESNERAIRFYKKNGFNIIGDHDFSIGKEDFSFKVMACQLKS
ncbi:MAG: GNAT family N-acetyltransferase [Saprospiraceae bacterium]|nr:GNAT family N-acetyltransferase [Saprospiraceae bacterium]